jgi:heme exporter protein A
MHLTAQALACERNGRVVPRAKGDLKSDVADLATSLHFIAHHDAMKPFLTVAENLHFWGAVMGGGAIDAALAAFNLDGLRHEAVQLLSAGQRRRLSLSRLFLVARPLWLLDEPMTALDAASKDLLRAAIKNHLREGGLVMAATHGDLGIVPRHVITLGLS